MKAMPRLFTFDQKRTLQQRLLIAIAFQAWDTASFAKSEAAGRAKETAYRYGLEVSARLDEAMIAARTIAQTFEGMKAAWVEDRSLFNSTLSQVQRQNPQFLATWTAWEPGALDSKDATFARQAGHDATGRFIPLWRREDKDVVLEPLRDYATPGAGDFYQGPRRSGKEVIAEPFRTTIGGREVALTSVAAPIRYNGDVVGVAGVHLALSSLQQIVERIKPYDTGYAVLISHGGTIVAHPDPTQVGRRFEDGGIIAGLRGSGNESRAITRESVSPVTKADVLEIFVPVQAGVTDESWTLTVVAPMDKVLAGAASVRARSIGIGVVAADARAGPSRVALDRRGPRRHDSDADGRGARRARCIRSASVREPQHLRRGEHTGLIARHAPLGDVRDRIADDEERVGRPEHQTRGARSEAGD